MSNMNASNYITALTTADLTRCAPSVFAKDYASDRSDKYTQFNTYDIIQALEEEGYVPTYASQGGRKRLENSINHATHMVRFTHRDNLTRDFAPRFGFGKHGGFTEIVLTNSHDGSTAFNIDAGFFRLVCANGMMVNMVSSEVAHSRIRHQGHSIDEVVAASIKAASVTDEIQDTINRWYETPLTAAQQRELARRCCALRYKAKNLNYKSLLTPRRNDDAQKNLWTVQNVIQENLIRGGVKLGKRLTRPLTNVKLNRALNMELWKATEEFYQEIAV